MNFYPHQLKEQYKLLRHKGHYTQVSCLDTVTGRQLSRELLNEEQKVIAWAKEWNGKGNCFLGRAPRDVNGNIFLTHTLSLDIDAVRAKGEAATVEAYTRAIESGKRAIQLFGFGALCCSGNGALILLPLSTSVNKETAEQWGKAIEIRARELLKEESVNVRVDSTYDIARLVKAMGTISTKGHQDLWRHAKFLCDPHHLGSSKEFYAWLENLPREVTTSSFTAPVHKGELDRSAADFALANRLKLQGFGPEHTYGALQSLGFRTGREDDHKRIIEKVFYGKGDVADMVSGGNERPIELITPQSGLIGYKSRTVHGTPELPTGFKAIDAATFGLIRGSLFTVGARTGCGKTTFAISTAINVCRAGKRVLFLSTETTYQEVWDRYFAVGTGISAFALQHGFKLNGHQKDLDRFVSEFSNSHSFTVYDGSRPSIAIVKKIVEQAKPDVLIFDYFQHVEARDVKALEEFVMSLHDLAKDRQFAILMCAQLHGRINPQTGKQYPPTLQDMKNSKVLNDESRVVLLLDWDNDKAVGDGPIAVKCVMAKNRGPKSDVLLKLERSVPRFSEE